MSAEHAKAKEPMPTRPPRLHPQGFICCLTDDERKALSEKVREANRRSESRPR